jgi:hypothetical protein
VQASFYLFEKEGANPIRIYNLTIYNLQFEGLFYLPDGKAEKSFFTTHTMKELKGQATPEQIAEWKQKHGDIFAVTVDGHIAYLKKPDRHILGFATAGSDGGKQGIKFNEILMKNCFLGGSQDIQTVDSLFLAASAKLGELIEIKEAELVKL